MKQITKSLMRFVFTIALLFGSASVWAQYYMDVTTKDGERILIPVADVNEVQIVNESDYHKPNGEHNGYEYVDLGLSVMWATCNVGANSPEEGGDYFAWGEVTPKEEYIIENYIFQNAEYGYTKYVYDSISTYFDDKITLDKCDDAARYNMGGSWRMPTIDEIKELIQNTTFINTTYKGVNGVRFFSKINGNSIFLPSYVNRDGQNYYVNYWSSSLCSKENYGDGGYYGAYALHNADLSLGGYMRYQGFEVRAVYSATTNIPTTMTLTFDANGGSGDMSSITIWSDDNSHSVAIPYNIDIIVRKNYKFIGWNTAPDGNGISYNDGDSIEITQDITLYAQWEELAPLDEAFYLALDGKMVKMTESVGSEYEAAYGALVTLLSEEDIINAGVVQEGFTAADYIGLKLTYNWYAFGYNCNYCIYINKKDYSVSAPEQVVAVTDPNFVYNVMYGYGDAGNFVFYGFNGELDTQTNILTMVHNAEWDITVGPYTGAYLGFGSDTYKIEFGEIIE